MKKFFAEIYLRLSVFSLLALPLSCASQGAIPPWDALPAVLRLYFPDSEYVAQRVQGHDTAIAEADGAAAIAQFFNSQISSQVSISEQYQEQKCSVKHGNGFGSICRGENYRH